MEEDLKLSTVEQEEKKEKRSVGSKKSYLLGMISGAALTLIAIGAGMIISSIYQSARTSQAIKDVSNTNTTVNTGNRELVNETTIKKMATIETIIDKYYFGDYTTDQLEEGVYDGMIAALDDRYARYYNAEEVKQLNQDTGGYFCGIGATVTMNKDNNLCEIVEPIEGSPAEEVGLLPGDLIYLVDGQDTTGMDLDAIVKLLRGDEGTTVKVTIIREGESDYLEFEIVRAKVDSTSVEYEMLENNIGHIAISTFDDNTAEQFIDALATVKGEGAEGIIIDLRSNLGGNLDAVVDICNYLCPAGNIVYTMDKDGKKQEYKSTGEHEIDLPLVVLVNQYSASASEILTGAVKDYHIGTIVGTTTYGKGVVQKVISLTDGSAMKLTASKYYTPSGVCINGTGIEPDVMVELDYENYRNNGIDNQLNTAVDEINKMMSNN